MYKVLRTLSVLTVLCGGLVLAVPALAQDATPPAPGTAPGMAVPPEAKAMHEKMQQDRATMKADHEKMQQDRTTMKADHEKMRAEHEKMRKERMEKMKQRREEMMKNRPNGAPPVGGKATTPATPATPATTATGQ